MANLRELDDEEFMEKQFLAAKEILPTLLSQHPPEYMIDKKKRSSVIFNCVSIAGSLLREIGYVSKGKPQLLGGDVGIDEDFEMNEDKTAIRKLGDLLKEDKEDKE